MRFEDLDKKIKEAADQHHPAYDEKAWRKMEKLLNQHLPQEKNDRRRILFLFLLLLLIGGGGYLLISQPWNKESGVAKTSVQDNRNTVEANKKAIDQNEVGGNQARSTQTDETNDESVSLKNSTSERTNVVTAGRNEPRSFTDQNNKTVSRFQPVKNQKPQKDDVSRVIQLPVTKANGDGGSSGNTQNKIAAPGIREENKDGSKSITGDLTKTKGETKNQVIENNSEEATKPEAKGSQKKAARTPNRNGFSFSVSAGPDVSKAGSSKTGKTTLLYGAGIGYTRNRFTLRAGMYLAKKIYWANANDYYLTYTPPPTVKFVGADANCDVIEIPVKLDYNFGMNDKHNWFASAGLSSYLMKKEKYVYIYKTLTGPSSYPYQAKNENKHYFSVLNLSGGYTRQLNSTFSVSAEPYVEVPLTGIGKGKVHLNSGGILFTIGVKPFKK